MRRRPAPPSCPKPSPTPLSRTSLAQRLLLVIALAAAVAGALAAVLSDLPPAERYDRCVSLDSGFDACAPD